MKIAMLYANNPPFIWASHDELGLGGSENGFVRTAQHLSRLGHDVYVFNRSEITPVELGRLHWANLQYFNRSEHYDVVLSLRHREIFDEPVNSKLRVLFLADTESIGLGESVRTGKINLVMAVSHWQKEKIAKEEGIPDDYWVVTSNGIDSELDFGLTDKILGRCIFMATPERGLDNLLNIWPRVKESASFASLHVYSSFLGWGISVEENEKMLAAQYSKMEQMRSLDVVNMRHANARQIREAQRVADLYLYPSDFYETCGMALLESMACGTIPIATGRAATLEKIAHGVTGLVVPSYGSSTKRYQDEFVRMVQVALSFDEKFKQRMRESCSAFASQFAYDVLVPKWTEEWTSRIARQAT